MDEIVKIKFNLVLVQQVIMLRVSPQSCLQIEFIWWKIGESWNFVDPFAPFLDEYKVYID